MPQASIQEILEKFELSAEDFERIRAVAPLLRAELDDHIESFYAWMRNHRSIKSTLHLTQID